MKPPDRFSHNDPREWLNRARSNLARAKTRTDDAYWEDLCFDAQQAAEKAAELTPYATLTRYPGPVRAVSVEEYRTAVQIAAAVVRWAEETV